MSTNPPKTPPRRDYGSQMWTPGTPRYAPMDEPDMFPGFPKHHKQHSNPPANQFHKGASNNKLVSHVDSKQATMVFPPTPEQTPFNRKRKNLDLISHTSTPPSGRILFPTPSPAKGTGRSYKHHRTAPSETSEKADQLQFLKVAGSEKKTRVSLNDCPSTLYASPVKKTKVSLNDCPSTSYASPVKKKKVSLNDCPSTSYASPVKKTKVSLNDCPSTSHSSPVKKPKTSLNDCPSTSYASPVKKTKSLSDCPVTPPRRLTPYMRFTKNNFTSPPEETKIDIFDDVKALKHEVNHNMVKDRRAKRKASEIFDPSYAKLAIADETQHPHDTQIDPTIPGMWYNFRGKKVFRPFAKGAAPLSDYKPRVLFGPRRDSKSLEESTIPIPKKDARETASQPTNTFAKRLRSSVSSKSLPSTRATTPEIDTEEDSSDCEDTGNPSSVTATMTSLERHEFVKPVQSRGRREAEKKHFYRWTDYYYYIILLSTWTGSVFMYCPPFYVFHN